MKRVRQIRHMAALVMVLSLAGCATPRERAISLSSEAASGYWGEWDVVLNLTSEAIAIDPKFAWPYSQRGAAYDELGMYDEAIADLKTAIGLDPAFGPAYTNLAMAYIRSGQFEMAGPPLREAQRITPADPLMMVTSAEYAALSGDGAGACQWLGKAVQRGFTDWDRLESEDCFDSFRDSDCYKAIYRDSLNSPANQ